jgi:hypothetical protein
MHLYLWTITIALFVFLYISLKSTFDVSCDSIGLWGIGGIKLSTKNKKLIVEVDRLFFSPFFWMNSGFRPFSLQLQGLKLKWKSQQKPNKTAEVPSITHTIPYLLSLLLNILFWIFELRIEGLELELKNNDRVEWWVRIETILTRTVSDSSLLEAVDTAFDGAETRCFGISLFLDRILVEDVMSRHVLESKGNHIALAFTRNRIKNSKVALVGVFGEWELKNPHGSSAQQQNKEIMDAYEIQRLSKMIVKKTRSFFHKSPRIYFLFSKFKFQVMTEDEDLACAACAQKVEITLICGSENANQIEVNAQIRAQGLLVSLGDSNQLGTIREVSIHSEIQCEVSKDDKCQILMHVNVIVNDPWMAIALHQIISLLETMKSETNPVSSEAKPPSKIFLADLKNLIDFQLGIQFTNANLALLVENIEFENNYFHFGTLVSLEQTSLSISTMSVDSADISIPRIDLHAAFDMHSLKVSTFERTTDEFLFEVVPDLDTLLSVPSLRFSSTVDIFRNNVESSLCLARVNCDLSFLTESRVPMYLSLIHHLELMKDQLPRKQPPDIGNKEPFAFIWNLHLTVGDCIILLASDENFTLTTVFSQLNGQFLLDDSLCSQVALEQICIEVGSDAQTHRCILKMESPQFIQKAIGAVLQINAKEIHLELDLSKFFAAFHSTLGILKLIRGLKRSKADEEETHKKVSLQLLAKIPKIHVDFELPEAVQTRFIFSSFRIKSGTEKNFLGDIQKIDIEVIRSPQTHFSELGVFCDTEFEINPGNEPIDIVLNAGFSRLFIAHGWPMSNIVENFVNLNRAVKQVVFEALSLPPPTAKFASGRTMVDTITFPNLIFKSAVLEAFFEDDPFESKLARNYTIGTDENGSRLIREKEFMRKVKSRYTDMNREEYARLKNTLYSGEAPITKM